MIISRNIEPSIINLNIRNNPIGQVQIHKHLGLLMNHKATWHDHIQAIINKANRRLGILKKMKYTLDRTTLKTIYVSYIRSTLEYGDLVWDNIPQFLADRL
jgi:hypothetical protein